jgi:DNA-directed RNA polymerase specialized sigma24 family protein
VVLSDPRQRGAPPPALARAARGELAGRGRDPDTAADPRSASGTPRTDPALRRRIGDAIAALPRGQREAFVLVHLEELTVAEAASATGRAVGTIKSHLHRALASLRDQLADLAREDADRAAEERR